MKKSDDAAREIHHRVKNNLQIIASILRLQMRREGSIEAQLALGGAVNRILGMVEVHDLLAHAPAPPKRLRRREGADARRVDLAEMLRRLLALHTQTFLAPGQTVRTSVKGPKTMVDADRALALSLAANELVVNAFKHAFAGRRQGALEATVDRAGGRLSIAISDDGKGLPPDFSMTGSSHLGLRLVRAVVEEDLKGTFSLTAGTKGARATVSIPD
jgi:two-component sensor histidine kinase